MTPIPTPHPDPADLLKLAQEKLGRKRTQRVLEHCKACNACADELLELVSAQPLPTGRPMLNKWNWISLAFLLAMVLGAFAILWWVAHNAVPPSAGL